MPAGLAEKIEVQEDLPEEGETRLLLHGVTWEQYDTLRNTLDDFPGLRMFYLEGSLEIMSPSPPHETRKKTIARLVEIYALEKDIELNGYGSTTFRAEAKKRGLEPDECYCFGELHEVPDIALEVVISSGGVDKLAIYQGLGVPEVWFWEKGRFLLYRLEETGYVQIEHSVFLPGLDFDLVAEYSGWENQTAAVKAFRATFLEQR